MPRPTKARMLYEELSTLLRKQMAQRSLSGSTRRYFVHSDHSRPWVLGENLELWLEDDEKTLVFTAHTDFLDVFTKRPGREIEHNQAQQWVRYRLPLQETEKR